MIVTEYVQENFVNDGMCADVCIHDTDGYNPHAHIMLTVRTLTENGKWQSKTEKEYLCVRDGEEQGFTAKEFKTAQADGWEKQYQYLVDKKKVYMPPSIAEAQGYERVSKYPKSTRYGRQNPIAERWNREEQLLIWRKNWADINNQYLEKYNSQERINHRSFAERGIDEQPTIHEGVSARILEQKGLVSERCEINRQIKADNKLLRELKEAVKNLAKAVIDTIPKLADALETMRKNIMRFTYQVLHNRYAKETTVNKIKTTKDNIQRYDETLSQLKAKVEDKKKTTEQKKATSILNIPKHREFAKILTTQTEEFEEIKTDLGMQLKNMNCGTGEDVGKLRKTIPNMEKAVHKYSEQEEKYRTELNAALLEFFDARDNAKDFDKLELINERLHIRPQKEKEFSEYVHSCGTPINPNALAAVLYDTDNALLKENLSTEKESVLEKLRIYRLQQQRQQREERRRQRKEQHKSHDDEEWER